MSTVADPISLERPDNQQDIEPIIGPYSSGIPMTPEEYDDLPLEMWERGYRYEVINGVLVVGPSPDAVNRVLGDLMGHLLR